MNFIYSSLADFLFAIIELFSLAVMVETLKTDIGASRHFSEGMGYFERKFSVEGDIAPNHCWHQKTRVFLLPHSEDRMILSSLVWVQYQRVTDGWTDEIVVANTVLCIVSNAAAL